MFWQKRYFDYFLMMTVSRCRWQNRAGVRKRADSYFPPEDRVRLVRLVSHGELPGERSGESTSEIS